MPSAHRIDRELSAATIRSVVAPPLMQVQPPRGDREVRHRAEEARAWAHVYGAMGWQVTPSCNGRRGQRSDGGLQLGEFWCAQQDLHPEDQHEWEREASSHPYALDVLWALRPAYGVIAMAGEGGVIAEVRCDHLIGAEAAEYLTVEGITAPVLRTAVLCGDVVVGERASIIIRAPGDPDPVSPPRGIAVQSFRHFLPLPGAHASGHVQWVTEPTPDVPLPQAAAILAALSPTASH